jgi:cytoskeletal protein CcmA (bactofilin family)
VNETGNQMGRHLDEMTLLLYVERQLDRERAHEVSVHTQTCERCLNLLRVLDRESRLLTRSMLEQDEPLPSRLAEFQAQVKRSMQWIWGVVFGMALLGVYSLYTGYVEQWEQPFEQAGFNSTSLLSLLVFQGAFWKGWQSMFTLVEFVAMASFAGFGLFLLRKYLKRDAALAVLFSCMGLMLLAPPRASAIETRQGDTVTIAKGEKIKGDIILNGQRIRVDGDVDGDLIVFSQDADIQGHVTGDVLGAAQTMRISGPVDGNVRAAANTLTVSGHVGHNLTGWAQHIALESTGRVEHSLWAFCQLVAVEGQVGGDVLAFDQDTSISGTVGGDVHARGESLSINSGSQINGTIKFEGAKPADVSPEAKLASPVRYTKLQHHSQTSHGAGYYIWRIIWSGAWILLGLVLISLMPRFASETIESAERYGASLGLGVLVFFGVAIAAVIACVTIVGLLVGISTLFLWVVSLFASYVVVGTVVGRWILGKATELWPTIGRMAIGVLMVVVAAGLPHVGFWIRFGVWIWGMGAISLALYRRLQPVIAPRIPSMPNGPVGTPLPPNTSVGMA